MRYELICSQCTFPLPPENIKKLYDFLIFSGDVEKGCIGNEWVNKPTLFLSLRLTVNIWLGLTANISLGLISTHCNYFWGKQQYLLLPPSCNHWLGLLFYAFYLILSYLYKSILIWREICQEKFVAWWKLELVLLFPEYLESRSPGK